MPSMVSAVLRCCATSNRLLPRTSRPRPTPITDTMLGVDMWQLAQSGMAGSQAVQSAASQPSRWGLIPRAAEQLMRGAPPGAQIEVTYLEIYNEAIYDLLAADRGGAASVVSDRSTPFTPSGSSTPGRDGRGKGLAIVTNAAGEVVVPHATVVQVHSREDVLAVLWQGARARSLASTDMNEHSSRSHTIFTCSVTGPAFKGKLTLVDLAGSEKLKSHAPSLNATRFSELTAINNSLTVLGQCIRALSSGGHVPYRDSKLTRLLADGLGGNCLTSFFVTLTPAWSAVEETASTLAFADRARAVSTHVVQNVAQSASQSAAAVDMVKRLRAENTQLRRALASGGSSESHAGPGMSSEALADLTELREEVASLRSALARSTEDLAESEAARQALLTRMQTQLRPGASGSADQSLQELLAAARHDAGVTEALRARVSREQAQLAQERAHLRALQSQLGGALRDLKLQPRGDAASSSAGLPSAFAAAIACLQHSAQEVSAARAQAASDTSAATAAAEKARTAAAVLEVALQRAQAAASNASRASAAGQSSAASPEKSGSAGTSEQAALDAAAEWTHHVDKSRARSYWHNKATKATTWTRPAAWDNAWARATRGRQTSAMAASKEQLSQLAADAAGDAAVQAGRDAVLALLRAGGAQGSSEALQAEAERVWSGIAEDALGTVHASTLPSLQAEVQHAMDLLAADLELR